MSIKNQDNIRRRFILWASGIGVLACLILSGIDLWRGGVEDTYWNLTYMGLILSALGVYLAFESKLGWAIMLSTIPVVHHSLAEPDILLLAYFWVYPIPLIVFFVLGLRRGTPLIATLWMTISTIAIWRAEGAGLSDESVDLALSFGFVCSMSWLYEHMRNRHERELESAMVTDELTGIANRRRFNEVLEVELKRSERYGGTFGLLIIDLDCFKSVNDTSGHPTGDRLLREFSSLVRERLRQTDHFSRIGGDEFAVIAPELDAESDRATAVHGVRTIASRLCDEISKHDFDVDQDVSASIGATIYRQNDDTKTIFQRADDALYRVKDGGRDGYEVDA